VRRVIYSPQKQLQEFLRAFFLTFIVTHYIVLFVEFLKVLSQFMKSLSFTPFTIKRLIKRTKKYFPQTFLCAASRTVSGKICRGLINIAAAGSDFGGILLHLHSCFSTLLISLPLPEAIAEFYEYFCPYPLKILQRKFVLTFSSHRKVHEEGQKVSPSYEDINSRSRSKQKVIFHTMLAPDFITTIVHKSRSS